MMGPRQEAQSALFYDFSIEDHVPTDHVLRAIDGVIDLSSVRTHLTEFYSSTGRPSIDPELMIRMLLVGYVMGIRSERRLCEEVHLNLAYRWFCKMDLSDPIPDHSTFSKNRHGRFRDSDVLRHVFETVVAQCIEAGLASGQRYAADASIIAADANRQKSTPKADWNPEAIDPNDAPRAVREYLDTLDDAAFGAASPVVPKFISHSDPASQWTGARGGPAYFAYSTNYLIDTDNAVILDVEPTRSIRQAEVGAVKTMIDRVRKTHDLKPERLIADTAYGSGPMLDWLVEERGIAPHIPVIDKSGRKDGTFERADFTFDTENDLYICPGGKELRQYRRTYEKPRTGANKDGTLRFRARKLDCDACALKSRCCPKEPSRKVVRSVYESSRDVARQLAQTKQYSISCRLRKKVEMSFAHLKRIHGLSRLRLRGPCGAHDEFILAATAQNLKKLAKLAPKQNHIGNAA
ncbi:transposase [Alteromonas sp. 5E99-2]|uniref:transposase n=1 Tax=Alteromonas sp. 5E99-2 TaxID=2817683 RepID=UPI001A993E93|nr:transposase [Alteromonas sp. 5E99-2]MBO1257122.1 transposase [Alteromonas sp. 5E99-2]